MIKNFELPEVVRDVMYLPKIGEACGMPDANYFSRVFRRVEGISPSEYRKQW